MSHLAKLTLSQTSPREPMTPLARKRIKLLRNLKLQIQLAEAKAKDEQFVQEIQRWVRGEDGKKELVTKHQPVKKWWWSNQHGAQMLSLKDGNKIIPLDGDNMSVEVGAEADVLNALETLRSAVVAGELDGQLQTVIDQRKSKSNLPKAASKNPVSTTSTSKAK